MGAKTRKWMARPRRSVLGHESMRADSGGNVETASLELDGWSPLAAKRSSIIASGRCRACLRGFKITGLCPEWLGNFVEIRLVAAAYGSGCMIIGESIVHIAICIDLSVSLSFVTSGMIQTTRVMAQIIPDVFTAVLPCQKVGYESWSKVISVGHIRETG
uniref:Uncharacterized protein n=1 Tax=Peronospora matthiolae TaxID=2874970 RepID=A0AAV1T9F5_9STRA